MTRILAIAALLGTLCATAAHAQSEPKEPIRVRLGAGAQIVPTFPGSKDTHVTPFPDFAIARGSEPFVYESPDESFGFTVAKLAGIEVGPAISFQGKRRRADTIVSMDEVGFSLETGGFAQLWVGKSVRLRAEARYGVTGHRAWVGSLGADYVIRDGDRYVFSIGPRLNLSDRSYQQTYFGVNQGEAARTGLAAYRPKGGIHSVGVIAGGTYSLGGRWGAVGYVRYDRLAGDAADSPFIKAYGTRDQFGAGAGLTYTFGRLRR